MIKKKTKKKVVHTCSVCGKEDKQLGGPNAMCWICIAEDDDFRKHRRRVWGS